MRVCVCENYLFISFSHFSAVIFGVPHFSGIACQGYSSFICNISCRYFLLRCQFFKKLYSESFTTQLYGWTSVRCAPLLLRPTPRSEAPSASPDVPGHLKLPVTVVRIFLWDTLYFTSCLIYFFLLDSKLFKKTLFSLDPEHPADGLAPYQILTE